ncbi:MAG: hypothetical protein L6W00_22175 [Lentisphaeria bacterium]|nr:MAG: hypothetical protein L6W00_22175 [Lentisphaeria bacterium]
MLRLWLRIHSNPAMAACVGAAGCLLISIGALWRLGRQFHREFLYAAAFFVAAPHLWFAFRRLGSGFWLVPVSLVGFVLVAELLLRFRGCRGIVIGTLLAAVLASLSFLAGEGRALGDALLTELATPFTTPGGFWFLERYMPDFFDLRSYSGVCWQFFFGAVLLAELFWVILGGVALCRRMRKKEELFLFDRMALFSWGVLFCHFTGVLLLRQLPACSAAALVAVLLLWWRGFDFFWGVSALRETCACAVDRRRVVFHRAVSLHRQSLPRRELSLVWRDAEQFPAGVMAAGSGAPGKSRTSG